MMPGAVAAPPLTTGTVVGTRADSPAPAAPVNARAAARRRLLLEGPIVSTLLGLAAPNLIVNVVVIAVTASVDAHFVGRLRVHRPGRPLAGVPAHDADAGAGGAADAAEVRILSAAAMQSAFKEVVAQFKNTSGPTLTVRYGTIGGITRGVLEGESADS